MISYIWVILRKLWKGYKGYKGYKDYSSELETPVMLYWVVRKCITEKRAFKLRLNKLREQAVWL